MITFDAVRGADGKVRVGVWDHFTTWGSKYKDNLETRFDEETLPQMAKNWCRRGDPLAMDFNHQSSYAAENGQPAPALAWYNALAVVRGGQCLCFESLDNGVQPPQSAGLADGLWGYRSEVTELGHELLPNFKFISPTFSPDGEDEQGNPIGYTLHAVAATNTPFQSGTGITFTGSKPRRNEAMANFEEETMKKLGLEAGADDEAVKAAYERKMEEGRKMLEEGEGDSLNKMAGEMDELAGHYEAAYGGGEAGPHVVMRKLAKRMATLAAGDPPFGGKETPEEEAAEGHAMEEGGDLMPPPKMEEGKMEAKIKRDYAALANRLGVRLPEGATSKQMFDAISAATVPAAQIPALVEAQVKRAMSERDAVRLRDETRTRAAALVDAAIEGGYPEAQRSALLTFASDPKSYSAAEAMVKPFLGTVGDSSVLFQKMTASGAPTGVDPRREGSTVGGKDRRVVRNSLATFVVDGEKFSNMAKEWADAKDGPMKLEIDGMLSDSEQAHSGYRLIAANRLLKTKRPDLWAAAEEQDL